MSGPFSVQLFYPDRYGKYPYRNRSRGKSSQFYETSDSAGDFAGTQATSAGVNVAGFSIDDCFDTADISFPGSVGTSVGVGYFDTEADAFTTEITFCHNGTSFDLSESQHS